MKSLFQKDIPPRAAAAVLALVLLASAVGGSEVRDRSALAEPVTVPVDASKRSAASPGDRQRSPAIDLDLERLHRPPKEGKVNDLFLASIPVPPAPRAPVPTPAPVVAPPVSLNPPLPPKPVAPALPFTYLGRLIDGDKTTVFVSRNNMPHSVSVGDSIGDIYKVDSIADGSIVFVYLPLGEKQTLSIPSRN